MTNMSELPQNTLIVEGKFLHLSYLMILKMQNDFGNIVRNFVELNKNQFNNSKNYFLKYEVIQSTTSVAEDECSSFEISPVPYSILIRAAIRLGFTFLIKVNEISIHHYCNWNCSIWYIVFYDFFQRESFNYTTEELFINFCPVLPS